MTSFKYISLFLVIAVISSCDTYLEEEPLKQASVKTTDQLEALINNNTIFINNNVQNSTMVYSTDDMDIPMAAYTGNPAIFSISLLLHYTFDINQLPTEANDVFWNYEYKKILTANIVLENVDRVTGPEAVKAQLRADAYMARAYSFWQLVNHYCLPYSLENESEPGLPLKSQVDYGESLKRANLKQTYDLIEFELLIARMTAAEDVDPAKPWRASKRGIDAMLSRFYLFKGDYTNSLVKSNEALATTSAKLVDFNTLAAGMSQTIPNPTIVFTYSELNDWAPAKHIYWKEFFYTRVSYNGSQWQLPAQQLVDLFDKTSDLRFKNLFKENGNRRFGLLSPSLYRYTFFQDGRALPLGPTVAEVLLNKAEALARTGKVTEAMEAVNFLRAKRMSPFVPLTAGTQTDAITKVLQERRREMPFSMRWFDIRRFSVNDYPADDVTVQRTFYKIENGAVNTAATTTYTLAPGSKRYAVPINNLEIQASQNQIEQNKY